MILWFGIYNLDLDIFFHINIFQKCYVFPLWVYYILHTLSIYILLHLDICTFTDYFGVKCGILFNFFSFLQLASPILHFHIALNAFFIIYQIVQAFVITQFHWFVSLLTALPNYFNYCSLPLCLKSARSLLSHYFSSWNFYRLFCVYFSTCIKISFSHCK